MVTVKVTENSGASARTATVNISTASEFGSVKVTQEGTTI
nr:MAG TPA: Putative binding domain, N-terminal [Bacteriophage sp.]DAN49523.1 MAG TPA: putative binding domain, N-terminal [Caudoviricetes sp.]